MGETSLYETDILAWTEEQAAALRALAGRPDLPNALDLSNVIEEIEALGRSEVRAATSPMRLILEHLVKLASAPNAASVPHWTDEIIRWHRDVRAALAPSMYQRVDLQGLWREAVRDASRSLRAHGDRIREDVPTECPLALEDFLAPDFDLDGALRRLDASGDG
ncbi:DUF29 domain-containing protein [Roseicella aquatilis]|nr:DUF29 domain-containing protein [Roseicella aquatilis]